MSPEIRTLDIPALPNVCDAHSLHYCAWGDAENPRKLLCLHGLTRNGRDFDFLAEAMADRYHVLCPDMPGRGASPALENVQQYTYATYLHDVLTLTHSLNITALDWVGTSMGGIMGMMLGAVQPTLIHKMVINDIGAVITKQGLGRIVSYTGKAGPFNTRNQAKDLLRERVASFGITQDAHWQHLFTHSITQAEDRRYYLAYDPELITPLRAETNNFEALEDILLWDYWNKLTCPILLLRGADSDIFLRDTADKMIAAHDRCKLIEYPGVGHAPALMETTQIKDVRKWLLAD